MVRFACSHYKMHCKMQLWPWHFNLDGHSVFPMLNPSYLRFVLFACLPTIHCCWPLRKYWKHVERSTAIWAKMALITGGTIDWLSLYRDHLLWGRELSISFSITLCMINKYTLLFWDGHNLTYAHCYIRPWWMAST